MKELFQLDKNITYLNFGSFGACPKEIFEDYLNWQYLLEKEPVQFVAVNGIDYINNSRKVLGDYLNCNSKDLVFVSNPTYAINVLAKNLNMCHFIQLTFQMSSFVCCVIKFNA